MIAGLVVVFVSFWGLAIASFLSPSVRARVLSRSLKAWVVDFSGLIVQGLAVPLVQAVVLAPLWANIFPRLQGAIAAPWWISFLLSFVVIDYVYYWNHRVLHLPIFWRWHRLHHSANEVDVFVTARNSLLTPIFIVYLWINSIFVFALGDPTPFLVASSVGAALDLWRHSGFSLSERSFFYRWLNPWLILPQHHARHHSTISVALSEANFGANFKWWDQAHGTFRSDPLDSSVQRAPEMLAVQLTMRELVWPSRERTS